MESHLFNGKTHYKCIILTDILVSPCFNPYPSPCPGDVAAARCATLRGNGGAQWQEPALQRDRRFWDF